MTLSNDEIRRVLTESRVIAVVGHSEKRHRTSYQIAGIMRELGYTIYPVNPTVKSIDGKICYPSLAEVPEPIDIVNVFRRSQFLEGVVEEAIQVGAKTIWAQLGVFDAAAAQKAESAGLNMIMDTCIKVAYYQLVQG